MNLSRIKNILATAFLSVAIPVCAFGANVDVFAEGAVNESELVVYVYADVNVTGLVSYGITLNYDPSELTVAEVLKDPSPIPYTENTTKWYLGESSAEYKNNPLPDYSVPGEVVIIGGKIDPASPAQGIEQGDKVFLGMVRFEPTQTQVPENPTLYLSYAKGDGSSSYKNFVRLDNNVPQSLDGDNVYFGSVDVFSLGDADGNGRISPSDVNAIKFNMGKRQVPCYMDCDKNGTITPSDINCIKSKI